MIACFLAYYIALFLIQELYFPYNGVIQKHRVEVIQMIILSLIFSISIKFLIKGYYDKKEKATRYNNNLNNIISNIGHELRNPINGILGVSKILKSDLKSTDYLEKINMIEDSTGKLACQLNDILDFYRLTNFYNIALNNEDFNLYKTLRASIEKHKKNLNPDVDIYLKTLNLKKVYNGDKRKLTKIFDHIIDNAIKFTKTGRIDIFLECTPQHITFKVTDTGIGMNSHKLKHLFKTIYAENLVRNQDNGLGLGLAIVKELVQLLQGKIYVQSNTPNGSIFTINIPLNTYLSGQEPSIAKKEHNVDFTTKKVLLVEDDFIAYTVCKRVLDTINLEFSHMDNGQKAVDYYKSNHQNFDIVLMDIQMPVMDGILATKLIREYEKEHNLIKKPILAVTANALLEDQDVEELYGMNDVVTKPYNLETLEESIKKQLSENLLFTEKV